MCAQMMIYREEKIYLFSHLLFSDIGESGRGAAVLTVEVTGTPPAGSTTIGGAANAVLLLLPLPAFLT